jgi:single-strand DNA-binding protein
MNTMTACGNATEVELRFTKAGKPVASFSIAMKSKKNDEVVTTWQKVEAWDELAENLAANVQKGDRVLVTGRIKTDEYTDKDGNKKTSQPILVAEEAGVSLRWSRRDA